MNKRKKRSTVGTSSASSGAGTKGKYQKVQNLVKVASTVLPLERNGSSPPIVSSTTSSPNTVKERVRSMEVIDGTSSTLLSHFGHGHLTGRGMTRNGEEPDSGITISLGKAVGARKRKPTQISKIVEKPSSDGDEESEEEESFEEASSEDHLHNNNNDSPPNYKKPWNQTGNGMIQSIVTELKSCARKSRESSNQPCSPPRSTASSKSSRSRYHSSSTEELNEHDDIVCGDDAGSFHCKETKLGKTGKNRKVDLANVHSLVGNEDDDSRSGLDLTASAYLDVDGRRNSKSKQSGDSERDESGPQPDTFRCGVCSYGSLDKATLLRHMKTHSGERPFQCRLCFFAFTTKANCERHLRNRHGQVDRALIRGLIVRFPTSNNGSESEAESHSPAASQSSYHHLQNALTGSLSAQSTIPLAKNLTSGGLLLQPKAKVNPNIGLSMLHQSFMSRLESSESKAELVKTSVTEDDGNAPLDLSMDAMDLSVSKKAKGKGPSSLLRPRAMYPNAVASRDLSNLLQTSPFVSKREAFVHPQISMPLLSADSQYGGLFQNGCSPFSPPTTNSTSMKSNTNPMDLASALHVASPFPMYPFSSALTGNGTGITSQFPSFNLATSGLMGGLNSNTQQMSPTKIATSFLTPSSSTTNFGSRENLRPLTPDLSDKESTETKSESMEDKLTLERKSKVFASPNSGSGSHKKRHSEGTKSGSNGGDYQKPKQRRYRTERPFSCPHCPARFTLRSNMERHGKHQHPTVWQRSPSNRVINRQQKNQQLQSQNPLVGPPTLVHPNKYNSGFEMLPPAQTKGRGRHSNQAHNMSQSPTSTVDASVNVRAVIAQQLKRKLSSTTMGAGDGNVKLESDSDEPNPVIHMNGAGPDLASVSQLLDRVKNSNIAQYFNSTGESAKREIYDDDEEMDDDDDEGHRSEDMEDEEVDIESEEEIPAPRKRGRPAKEDTSSDGGLNLSSNKKKSAYSSAPHKISCPHCSRRFPWFSSLRRHLLTHTGQKPYQCSKCPLLFTTKSNCDRHLARKHNGRRANGKARQTSSKPAPGTGSSNYNSTEEDDEENEGIIDNVEKPHELEAVSNTPTTRSSTYSKVTPTASSNSSPGEDVVFRCHLCEAAAGEREVLLAHMEEEHKDIYKMLVTKGALNSSPNTSENSEVDGTTPPNPGESQQLLSVKEGSTHRKVMCVFCVRRFWSVEDLRRHIRSHSGERPFSCPHCSRRFTLKHSMLRHLKKHGNSGINTPISGLELGEEQGDRNAQAKLTVPPIKIRRPRGRIPNALKKQGNASNTRAAIVAPAPITPENDAAESDLIGRLLGIHDESLVEKLLNKPDAKDAAKLLGLRSGKSTTGTGSTN